MEIPEFGNKKELFNFLVANKNTLIAQKKGEIKMADAISCNYTGDKVFGGVIKSEEESGKLLVKAVINTTNLMDSHNDVHMKGIWTKTLKENKNIIHLQEHQMSFKNVIADGDDVKPYVKEYSWKELGYNFDGTTEALVFESNVSKERNPFMYDQYKKGYVKSHSVGMIYVKIVMCINDEDYGAEYEAWEKYIKEVANKEEAESQGFFWAVTEAKVIEGSAVLRGSNYATPTLLVEEKGEPFSDTHKSIEPSIDTQKEIYEFLKENFKLKL